MASIKSIPLKVTFLLCFCATFVVQYGQATVHHQNTNYAAAVAVPGVQQAAGSGHRVVEEKDYAVDGIGWSPWLLVFPVIFIPLILLLCTPLFHSPGHGHYGHDHGAHLGHGYGWGTYNLGWKRSLTGQRQSEDLITTRRVLSSISSP